MKTFAALVLATLPMLAMTIETAPAVSQGKGCGLTHVMDPSLRASFEQFERNQSRTAANICAAYLNSAPALRIN